jgi:hypothetical protein
LNAVWVSMWTIRYEGECTESASLSLSRGRHGTLHYKHEYQLKGDEEELTGFKRSSNIIGINFQTRSGRFFCISIKMFIPDCRRISLGDEDAISLWLTFEQKREGRGRTRWCKDPHWIWIGRRGVIRVSGDGDNNHMDVSVFLIAIDRNMAI